INVTLECVHNYTHETVEPATCTETGTKNSTCTVCGYSFISEIPPLGHRYQSQTVTEATCTTDGLRRYTCSVCGYTYDEPILASHTDVDDDAICDVCGEICQGIIASGSCGENLTWTLYENKLLRISGTGEMTDYFNTSNPFYANRGNIERVIIEEGATNISREAFEYLNNLVSVSVSASVTSIDERAFANSTLTTITFAQNSQLETIGESAFYYCDLTEFNMPSTVTSIGVSAFYACDSLTAVNIPAGVTQIADNTFSYCDSLSAVVFEENSQLETIGKNAFYDCSITSLTVPASVREIGDSAFGSNAITSLTFAENGSLETIGASAFSSNALENVFIPDTVKTLGDRVFAYCTTLTRIDVDADNPNYCSVDGVLFNKDKTVLMQYPVGKADTSYSIPYGVETIDKYAFAYLGTAHTGENVDFNGNYGDYAVSITIPDTVSTISDYAFYASSITDVTIPESVTTIGAYAFYCYYLNNITVMNPECALTYSSIIPYMTSEDKDGDGYPDSSLGTIKGYTASTAEDYAEMCSVPFESLDDRYVMGVEIIELPSKVDYLETESFSTSGLKLRVTYDDNSTAEKLYGFTAEGFNRTNYGTSTITVTYKGFSDTYDITITEVPELKAGEKLNINSENRSGWFKFIPTVEKSYYVGYQTDSTDYISYGYSVYNSEMEYSADHKYTDKSFTAGEIYYIYYSFSSSDLPDDLTISVKCRFQHEYAETSRIEPTCTEAGTVVYNCTVCNEEKTESIDPLGHDYSTEWTIDIQPDCINEGSKSHHCSRCDSKTDITVVPALGHDMGEYVQTKAPTCTAKGSEKSTCSRCSYYETRDIDPLGHDYSTEWTIDKQPTCTLDGSKSHHCSRCDSKADVTVIPADGHSY
ncbi:MAG: leucine-rich repeat domain-containing protein, partial [Acutalibacteraceae bacterium]